jgi:hypothetical protein
VPAVRPVTEYVVLLAAIVLLMVTSPVVNVEFEALSSVNPVSFVEASVQEAVAVVGAVAVTTKFVGAAVTV